MLPEVSTRCRRLSFAADHLLKKSIGAVPGTTCEESVEGTDASISASVLLTEKMALSRSGFLIIAEGRFCTTKGNICSVAQIREAQKLKPKPNHHLKRVVLTLRSSARAAVHFKFWRSDYRRVVL